MEAVGTAASLLGIATAVLATIKSINDNIENVKGTHQRLLDVKSDLDALAPVLATLANVASGNEQQLRRKDVLLPAVKNCKKACDDFQSQLRKWSKKSDNAATDQVSRFATIKIGLFAQRRIDLFSSQLGICKETLTLVLVTENL